MYANNAGLDVYSSTLGIRAKASVHITGVSDMRENSYEAPGVNFLSGLYAKAINNALDNNTPEGTKPVEAFGAVIEDLRADGLVQRLHNIPAMNDEQYYDLPNKYVTYVSYLDQSGHENFLNLPNQPKKGQVVEIARYGDSGTVYVKSTRQTTVSGASSKIRAFDGFKDSVQVNASAEKFIFQGDYWLLVRFDS
jgi:hypothetical protein